MTPLSHMSRNKFGRFSIDHTLILTQILVFELNQGCKVVLTLNCYVWFFFCNFVSFAFALIAPEEPEIYNIVKILKFEGDMEKSWKEIFLQTAFGKIFAKKLKSQVILGNNKKPWHIYLSNCWHLLPKFNFLGKEWTLYCVSIFLKFFLVLRDLKS